MNQNETKGMEESQAPPKTSRKFLWIYATALFSVAFLLILFSYLGQHRAENRLQAVNRQLTENVERAQGALQKVENLQRTVDDLEQSISELEEALAEGEERNKALEALIAEQEEEARQALAAAERKSSEVEALEDMWKLERAYRLKRRTEARGILRAMEENGADAYLSEDTLTEYYAIQKALG